MIERGLVDPRQARGYFDSIEPELFRFPAIDPPTFRRAVETAFRHDVKHDVDGTKRQ